MASRRPFRFTFFYSHGRIRGWWWQGLPFRRLPPHTFPWWEGWHWMGFRKTAACPTKTMALSELRRKYVWLLSLDVSPKCPQGKVWMSIFLFDQIFVILPFPLFFLNSEVPICVGTRKGLDRSLLSKSISCFHVRVRNWNYGSDWRESIKLKWNLSLFRNDVETIVKLEGFLCITLFLEKREKFFLWNVWCISPVNVEVNKRVSTFSQQSV